MPSRLVETASWSMWLYCGKGFFLFLPFRSGIFRNYSDFGPNVRVCSVFVIAFNCVLLSLLFRFFSMFAFRFCAAFVLVSRLFRFRVRLLPGSFLFRMLSVFIFVYSHFFSTFMFGFAVVPFSAHFRFSSVFTFVVVPFQLIFDFVPCSFSLLFHFQPTFDFCPCSFSLLFHFNPFSISFHVRFRCCSISTPFRFRSMFVFVVVPLSTHFRFWSVFSFVVVPSTFNPFSISSHVHFRCCSTVSERCFDCRVHFHSLV